MIEWFDDLKVGMRLPTEFEWEFAARAGIAASQPQGISDYAWTAPTTAASVEKKKNATSQPGIDVPTLRAR